MSEASEVAPSLDVSDDAPPPLLAEIEPIRSPMEGPSRQSSPDSPPLLIKALTANYMQTPLDLTSVPVRVITTQTNELNSRLKGRPATSANHSQAGPLSHAAVPVITPQELLPTFVAKKVNQPTNRKPSIAQKLQQPHRRKSQPSSIRSGIPATSRTKDSNATVMTDFRELAAQLQHQQAMAAAVAARGMVPVFGPQISTHRTNAMSLDMSQMQHVLAQQAFAQHAAVSNIAFAQVRDVQQTMPGPSSSLFPQNIFLNVLQQQQQQHHQHQQQQQQQQHHQQHHQNQQQQQYQFQIPQASPIHANTQPQFQTYTLQQPQMQPRQMQQRQMHPRPQQRQPPLQPQVNKRQRKQQKSQAQSQQCQQRHGGVIGIAAPQQSFGIASAMDTSTSSTPSNVGVRLATSVNPASSIPQLIRPQAQRPQQLNTSTPALAAALSSNQIVMGSSPQFSFPQQQYISVPIQQRIAAMEQFGFLQQASGRSIYLEAMNPPLIQPQPMMPPNETNQFHEEPPVLEAEVSRSPSSDGEGPPVLESNATVPVVVSAAAPPPRLVALPPQPGSPLLNTNVLVSDVFAREAAANRAQLQVDRNPNDPLKTFHFIDGLVIEESSKSFTFSDAEATSSGSDSSESDPQPQLLIQKPSTSDELRNVKKIENLGEPAATEKSTNRGPVLSQAAPVTKAHGFRKTPSPEHGSSGVKNGKVKHKTDKKNVAIATAICGIEKVAKKKRARSTELQGLLRMDFGPRDTPFTASTREDIEEEIRKERERLEQYGAMKVNRRKIEEKRDKEKKNSSGLQSPPVNAERDSEDEPLMPGALYAETVKDDLKRPNFCMNCALSLTPAAAYSFTYCNKNCRKLFKKNQKIFNEGGWEDEELPTEPPPQRRLPGRSSRFPFPPNEPSTSAAQDNRILVVFRSRAQMIPLALAPELSVHESSAECERRCHEVADKICSRMDEMHHGCRRLQ